MSDVLQAKAGAPIGPAAMQRLQHYLDGIVDAAETEVAAAPPAVGEQLRPYVAGLRSGLSQDGWHRPIRTFLPEPDLPGSTATVRRSSDILGDTVARLGRSETIFQEARRGNASTIHRAPVADLVVITAESSPFASSAGRQLARIDHVGNGSATPATDRLRYIQLVRSFAILFVVAAHSSDPLTGNGFMDPVYPYLFRHANALFVFISGFLFQYLKARFGYRKYLITKVRNVVLPYVVMSCPALIIYVIGLKMGLILSAIQTDYIINNIVHALLTGSRLAPFWFIPMMAIFFIFAPAIHLVDTKPILYLVLIPLFALSFWVGRTPNHPFQNALFYLPVYVSGMLASNQRERLIPFLRSGWPMLLTLSLVPWTIDSGAPGLDYAFLISKLLWCLCIMGMIDAFDAKIPAWFDTLGDMSFGIFFVHYYIISCIKNANAWLGASGISFVVVTFTITLLASILFVICSRKILGQRPGNDWRLIVRGSTAAPDSESVSADPKRRDGSHQHENQRGDPTIDRLTRYPTLHLLIGKTSSSQRPVGATRCPIDQCPNMLLVGKCRSRGEKQAWISATGGRPTILRSPPPATARMPS